MLGRNALGFWRLGCGDYAQAEVWYEEGLMLAQEIGDLARVAWLLDSLAGTFPTVVCCTSTLGGKRIVRERNMFGTSFLAAARRGRVIVFPH